MLVRPRQHQRWEDISQKYAVEKTEQVVTEPPSLKETGAGQLGRVCEVGLDMEMCYENEECVAANSRSRNGVCMCKEGFVRNSDNDQCVKKVQDEKGMK